MNERRPPPGPPQRPPLRTPRKGDSSGESTVLAPMPAFTDDGSVDESSPVFDADDPTGDAFAARRDDKRGDKRGDKRDEDSNHTHTMKKPQRVTISSTADVSVIEAKELRPAASDANFGFDVAHTSANEGEDGIMFDEGYSPATEVLRLAFSDADGESVTPTGPVTADGGGHDAPPVEVRKWRTGGGERPPRPPDAGPAPAPQAAQPPAPTMAVGTRIDLVTKTPGRAAPLDVDELRRTLEEAEKLLRTVKHQASGLDLDLVAPGARGMNAQLAAALHRLSEALAMLGK